jgi:hypothetical protein
MYASFFISSATLFSSQGGAVQFFPGSNLERGCVGPDSEGGAAAPVRVGIAVAGVDLLSTFVVASEEAVFALCEGKVKPGFGVASGFAVGEGKLKPGF